MSCVWHAILLFWSLLRYKRAKGIKLIIFFVCTFLTDNDTGWLSHLIKFEHWILFWYQTDSLFAFIFIVVFVWEFWKTHLNRGRFYDGFYDGFFWPFNGTNWFWHYCTFFDCLKEFRHLRNIELRGFRSLVFSKFNNDSAYRLFKWHHSNNWRLIPLGLFQLFVNELLLRGYACYFGLAHFHIKLLVEGWIWVSIGALCHTVKL